MSGVCFVRLTSAKGGVIFINLALVESIWPQGTGSKLFVTGDPTTCHYVVDESPAEIAERVSEVVIVRTGFRL